MWQTNSLPFKYILLTKTVYTRLGFFRVNPELCSTDTLSIILLKRNPPLYKPLQVSLTIKEEIEPNNDKFIFKSSVVILAAFKREMLNTWEMLPQMFITSAETKSGREELLKFIEEIVMNAAGKN